MFSCHTTATWWEGTLGLKPYLAIRTHCFALGLSSPGVMVKMGTLVLALIPPRGTPYFLRSPSGTNLPGLLSFYMSCSCSANKTTRKPLSWGNTVHS